MHFKDQTLRQIAHVSIGGSRVRIVLSNSLGTLPLRIGAAQVALRDKGASIVADTNRALTFGGGAQFVSPAGALLVSDPIDLKVRDFGDVVVDLYMPDDSATWKSPLTVHPASWQVNYVSTPGNHAGTTTFPRDGREDCRTMSRREKRAKRSLQWSWRCRPAVHRCSCRRSNLPSSSRRCRARHTVPNCWPCS